MSLATILEKVAAVTKNKIGTMSYELTDTVSIRN